MARTGDPGDRAANQNTRVSMAAFALDLAPDGIRFLARDGDVWTTLETARLEDPDLAARSIEAWIRNQPLPSEVTPVKQGPDHR